MVMYRRWKKIINKCDSHIVNKTEPSGSSPTLRCVFEGQLAPLYFLVAAGVNLSAQDGENWTVLHVTARMDENIILNIANKV